MTHKTVFKKINIFKYKNIFKYVKTLLSKIIVFIIYLK